jgi:ATP-binding cassette subfamily B protein
MEIKSYQARIDSLKNSLEEGVQELSADTGSLIYSKDQSPDQYLLLLSGSVRLIDHNCTFGSLTAGTLDSQQIFGIENFLSITSFIEIRCLTQCKYILLDPKSLNDSQNKQIQEILTSRINATEAISIFSLISINFPLKVSQIGSLNDVLRSTKLLMNESEIDDHDAILFLDKECDGFVYGQIITPEICSSFFTHENWPRVVGIQFRKEIEVSNNSKDHQTISTTEQKQQLDVELPLPQFVGPPEEDQQVDQLESDGFRVIRADTQETSFASCLNMLVNFYQLPTRRDTITRAAEILANCKPREQQQLKSKQPVQIPWMGRLLSILDELGLAVRWITIDPRQPFRIPTPSIWVDHAGNPILLTRTTGNALTIIDPRDGRVKLNRHQAEKKFNSQPIIISTDVGLHTPKKQFGVHWLFPYIKRYRFQLIEVFSASFLNQLFALATPLLFQQIIDRVISKGAFDALAPLVILMLIFVVLETVFSSLRTFQFVEVSNRIDISVGASIVSRLLRINARFFDRRPVGELASRLGELENIRRFLTGTALTVVLDAIFATLYFAVMFFYSPLLTLIILLTVPLLFGITLGITPITQRLIRARAEASSRTQSLLVEILGGIQTVKLQNAELIARRQWEDRHLQSINKGFQAVLANTSTSNALQLINKISSILVIGIGAWLVLNNELTLGQLIAFRIISNYVTQPMLRLASTWQNFQELSLSLERVGDVVNQPLEIGEDEELNIVMPSLRGDVSVRSLSYTYTSSSSPILSSIDLDISAGSFVGLVGESGCGKSTLLKMVPRLYRPTSGKILIDQLDISKVELYSLRSQIGFVPQDCLLFEGTVFSNIALGDPQAESSRVIEMATIACAHEFIMNLPRGYSTPVGEKGSGLSGGQRQRIALARMLMENPKLIVLDEATSALDVNTERQVVRNLRDHLQDQTVLMITHRLSTLIAADQIVLMHAGRIDEKGTHQQLMQLKGRYFALYQSQFGET